jgi:hypothetical protein
VVDKPPSRLKPDLAEQVERTRSLVRRDAVQSVIDAVESYQAELPKSGAGHQGRLRQRWDELEEAIIAAAECLQAKAQSITHADIERQKRINALDWNIDPRHRRK